MHRSLRPILLATGFAIATSSLASSPPKRPCSENEASPPCPTLPGALLTFPPAYRRYVITTPTVDTAYASALAANDFNLSGVVTEDSISIEVASSSRSLIIYKDSGEFQYQDDSKLWNPAYPPPALNQAQAVQVANTFLAQYALLPSQASVSEVEPASVKAPDGTTTLNHWVVTYEMLLDARAGLGTPLAVPVAGGSITAQVGNGELIGLHWNWRQVTPDLSPAGTLVALSRDAALTAARQLFEFTPFCPETTTRLLYTLDMHTGRQALLAPSYAFFAEALDDGVTVPATAFSPRAVITSPTDDSEFAPCTPLTFAASVSGGTPPYAYEWTDSSKIGADVATGVSQPDDILGTTNPLTVSLEGGTHNIEVKVTDSNGLSWRQGITIRAVKMLCLPRPAAACPEPASPDTEEPVKWLGWTMHARITHTDGLQLDDVSFLGNRLARDVEVPFYWFSTELMPHQACELKHPPEGNAAGNCVSHLKDPGIRVVENKNELQVHACYCVDHLPTGPKSGTLTVCQVYIFYEGTKGCDPVDTKGDCVPYLPLLQYWYEPPLSGGNGYNSSQWDQRFDYDLPDPPNRAAFFKDPDFYGPNPLRLLKNIAWLHEPGPPNEGSHSVAFYGVRGDMDNYHQKQESTLVRIPGCVDSGKWNCSHIHWRWGSFLKFHGSGAVLPPSNQSVRAWSVLFGPTPEVDPLNFELNSLVSPPLPIGDTDQDLVFWDEVADLDPSDEKVFYNDWFFH
jgi:hypothetical protein